MEKIAFIIGGTYIYWSSVIIVMGVIAAILLFVSVWLKKGGDLGVCAVLAPLGIVLSILLSRALHWYCRYESYSGFWDAMTNYSGGGYAMLGVFAGCILAAVIVRLLKLTDDLPELLDCMAPAGAAGIAIGRLSALFNSLDRGMLLKGVKILPFASPVVNSVSGVTEYRLATFMLQAIAAAVICAVLLKLMRAQSRDGVRDPGGIFLVFALLYGATEIVLDSTRYDALFLRSNGFVSIVQIVGALSVAFVIVMFSVRMLRRRSVKFKNIAVWIGALMLFGGVGYMEYYVQRHGDRAAIAYSVMSLCLAGLVWIALSARKKAIAAQRCASLRRAQL